MAEASFRNGTVFARGLLRALAIPFLFFAVTGRAADEFAGSETCATCHEDIAKAFLKSNRHAELEPAKHLGWAGRACEACHGSGVKHAESTDKADIRNPARLAPKESERTCLRCHSGQQGQTGRMMNSHSRGEVACASCHNIHTPPAVANRALRLNELCSTCHYAIRAQFARPHAHPVAKRNAPVKPMACVDCHNPHGSPLAKNFRAAVGGEPGCLNCHGDKRGPFAFEHAVVRLEGCTACHEPHGSTNPRMLTRPNVAQQCLECHANVGAPGGLPPAFHDLASARFRNCTLCHQKIHGSHVSKALLR